MPLCSGKTMAIHGGSFLSRSFCPPAGANNSHQRLKDRRVEFWLGLQRPRCPSSQPWSAVARLRPSGCRLARLDFKATAEQHEFDAGQRDGATGGSEPLGSSLSSDDLNSLDSNGLISLKQPEQSCETDSGSMELVDATSMATGSVFGAMALITGSSVGAGILALPAITAPTGFIPSATLMGVSWAFLVLEALLLAEVNVELMRKREAGVKLHSEVLSLTTMADQTMGPLGGLFTTLIYLMLSYTLLVAYVAKSGEVLSLLLHIPNQTADAIFTFGFGGLLSVGGSRMADSLNQVLTVMLLGLFILIVLGGASIADWTGLEHVDWTLAPHTLPIIFLALVYHDLIPVVCAQLGGDIGRIRISILLGSIVPLAMFLSWDAVALCLTPLSGAKDPIDVFMRIGGPGPAFVVESFALLAVATSFIGTVLGLSEFLLEQLGKAQGLMLNQPRHRQAPPRPFFKWLKDNNCARAFSFLLVLAPPFVASSLVSDAFFSASDLAGAYGMTSLYGVIPPIMAWSLQNSSLAKSEGATRVENPPSMSVPGGKITLATIGACAIAMIMGQVVLDLPQLSSPSLGTSTGAVLAKSDQESFTTPTSLVVNHQYTALTAP